jgi:hypothetical protein
MSRGSRTPPAGGAIAAILAASAVFAIAAASAAIYQALPESAATAAGFAPEGWTLAKQATGDLNKDGVDDIAMVLRAAGADGGGEGGGEAASGAGPAVLAVAFGEKAGGYRLALENRTLIPATVMADAEDPLAGGGVAIARGTLKVSLDFFASAGSWQAATTTYTFRFQDEKFALIGFDRNAVHRGSGETTGISINYLTRKAEIVTGNIASDAQELTRKSLPKRPLLSIEEIGDGLAFDPGV